MFGHESHKLQKQVRKDVRRVWPIQGIFGAHGANTDPLDRSARAARSILVSPYGSRRGSTVSQPICASGREAHCLRCKVGLTSGEVQHAHKHFVIAPAWCCSPNALLVFLGEIWHWRIVLGRHTGLSDEEMATPSSSPHPAIICSTVPLLIEYLSMSRLKSAVPTLERGRGKGHPIPLSGRCGAENQARYLENAKQEPHALLFPPTVFV